MSNQLSSSQIFDDDGIIRTPVNDDSFFRAFSNERLEPFQTQELSKRKFGDNLDELTAKKFKKSEMKYCSWNAQQELFLVQQVLKHRAYIKTASKTKGEKFGEVFDVLKRSPLFAVEKDSSVILHSLYYAIYYSYYYLEIDSKCSHGEVGEVI